jgi:hypothetical protein
VRVFARPSRFFERKVRSFVLKGAARAAERRYISRTQLLNVARPFSMVAPRISLRRRDAMADFLPRPDLSLLAWSRTFGEGLNAQQVALGIPLDRVAAYDALLADFVEAMRVVTDPATRSPTNVLRKDTARAALVASTRALARTIQGVEGLSDTDKIRLGLTARKTRGAPIAAPATVPTLSVESAWLSTVNLRVRDSVETTRRGRPRSIAGATIYSWVGEAFATDARQLRYEGDATRPLFQITFPEDTPRGSRVWFVACWYTARGKRGAMSRPIDTIIAGGGLQMRQSLQKAV